MNVLVNARTRASGLFTESISDNPVVSREFRTRMRGWKAFAVMGGYVLFLAAVVFIKYVDVVGASGGTYYGPQYGGGLLASSTIGQKLFSSLNWTQTILLALIIPALTFGSVTQELEKRTIEMLALTRLSAGKIVIGKQLTGFLYALVLLVCSAPLAAMCLMFGGISPAEIAITYALLVVWAFLFSAVGVFWSSMFTRTSTAALFTYGTCALYMLISSSLGSSIAMRSWHGSRDVFVLSLLSPSWGPEGALLSAKVCSVTVPLALAAGAAMAGVAWLLLLVASTHIRHHIVERALPIRLVLLGLTVLLAWLFFGNMAGGAGFGIPLRSLGILLSQLIAPFVGIMMGYMCLAASVFATGEMRRKPHQSAAAYALSPLKAFRSDLGGGISFMVLWTAVLYATMGASMFWALKSAGAAAGADVWYKYLGLAGSALAVVIGVSAVGVLVSSIVRLRRNAAALVILFTIVIFSVYPVVLAYYQPHVSNAANPIWQAAAFWPLTPVFQMAGGWKYWPALWWQADVSWMVVGAVYLLIAAAALGIASAAARRYPGVQEE